MDMFIECFRNQLGQIALVQHGRPGGGSGMEFLAVFSHFTFIYSSCVSQPYEDVLLRRDWGPMLFELDRLFTLYFGKDMSYLNMTRGISLLVQ